MHYDGGMDEFVCLYDQIERNYNRGEMNSSKLHFKKMYSCDREKTRGLNGARCESNHACSGN